MPHGSSEKAIDEVYDSADGNGGAKADNVQLLPSFEPTPYDGHATPSSIIIGNPHALEETPEIPSSITSPPEASTSELLAESPLSRFAQSRLVSQGNDKETGNDECEQQHVVEGEGGSDLDVASTIFQPSRLETSTPNAQCSVEPKPPSTLERCMSISSSPPESSVPAMETTDNGELPSTELDLEEEEKTELPELTFPSGNLDVSDSISGDYLNASPVGKESSIRHSSHVEHVPCSPGQSRHDPASLSETVVRHGGCYSDELGGRENEATTATNSTPEPAHPTICKSGLSEGLRNEGGDTTAGVGEIVHETPPEDHLSYTALWSPTPIEPHSASLTSPLSPSMSVRSEPAMLSSPESSFGHPTSLSPAPTAFEEPERATEETAPVAHVSPTPSSDSTGDDVGNITETMTPRSRKAPPAVRPETSKAPLQASNEAKRSTRGRTSEAAAMPSPAVSSSRSDEEPVSAEPEIKLSRVQTQPERQTRQSTTATSATFEQLKHDVPVNYREYGIDSNGVEQCRKANPLNPLSITVNPQTRKKVLLTTRKVDELNGLVKAIVQKWPKKGDAARVESDVESMVAFFGTPSWSIPSPGWRGVVVHEKRAVQISLRMLNIHEFMMHSAVHVGCSYDSCEVCIFSPLENPPLTTCRRRKQ